MNKRKKERVVYIPNQIWYTQTVYNAGEQSDKRNKKLSEEYQRKLARDHGHQKRIFYKSRG